MKSALALVAIGALALLVEGALVFAIPAALLPNVALVLSVSAALYLGGTPALLVLAALGFASDLLGGSPLGLGVLALLVPFAVTRIANRSLELRHGASEAILLALLTPVAVVAMAVLVRPEGGVASHGLAALVGLALQTGVNALIAPSTCRMVEAVASAAGELDPTRRGVAWIGAAPWAASRR